MTSFNARLMHLTMPTFFHGESCPVSHTPQKRFRLPSEGHSIHCFLPRSQHPQLSERKVLNLLTLLHRFTRLNHKKISLSRIFLKFFQNLQIKYNCLPRCSALKASDFSFCSDEFNQQTFLLCHPVPCEKVTPPASFFLLHNHSNNDKLKTR